MSNNQAYYDWLTEHNLSDEEQSKLTILLHLLSDKLTEAPIASEYAQKVRSSVPQFVSVLDAPAITQELVYSIIEESFPLSKESITQLFDALRQQGNYKELAQFMR